MLELAEHLGSLPEGTTHEGQGVHTAKMFRLVAKARDSVGFIASSQRSRMLEQRGLSESGV